MKKIFSSLIVVLFISISAFAFPNSNSNPNSWMQNGGNSNSGATIAHEQAESTNTIIEQKTGTSPTVYLGTTATAGSTSQTINLHNADKLASVTNQYDTKINRLNQQITNLTKKINNSGGGGGSTSVSWFDCVSSSGRNSRLVYSKHYSLMRDASSYEETYGENSVYSFRTTCSLKSGASYPHIYKKTASYQRFLRRWKYYY